MLSGHSVAQVIRGEARKVPSCWSTGLVNGCRRSGFDVCGVAWYLVDSGFPSAWRLVAFSTSVQAAELEHEGGEHHEEYPNLLGLKLGHLSMWEFEEDQRKYSQFSLAAGSYERVVIPGWLELELTVPVAVSLDESSSILFPIDLHLKKPFHPSAAFSPYVALGPAVDIRVRPEMDLAFGVSMAIGTYWWTLSTLGVDLEIDYNVVTEAGSAGAFLAISDGPCFPLWFALVSSVSHLDECVSSWRMLRHEACANF